MNWKVKKGKEYTFTVNYYNDFSRGNFQSFLECPQVGALLNADEVDRTAVIPDAPSATQIIGTDQVVEVGEYKGFKFILPNDPTVNDFTALVITTPHTEVCRIVFCKEDPTNAGKCLTAETATKQLIIKVQ